MSASPVKFLQHILGEIEFILDSTKTLSYNEFLENEKDKRAVTRSLEIIGEAIKNLPKKLRNRYPYVDWKSAAGLRDRLIHGYFNVDYDIIWNIMRDELPQLKRQIESIIQEIEE